MALSKKKTLGQHNTENVDYILRGFESFIHNKEIIDPFCGDFHLLDWAITNGAKGVIGIDVDETKSRADVHDDTLLSPFDYDFVLTNPPYLAKNKSKDKSIFIMYNTDDLYKASIQTFMNSNEGIFIVPINFLCSKEFKTRKMFLDKFNILKATLFEEQVFPDTTSTVIAIYYKKGDDNLESFELLVQPSGKIMSITLDKRYNYRYGTDFFKFLKPASGIKRLMIGEDKPKTNLYIHCLDTSKPIRLEYQEDHYYGMTSDRSKASIVINKDLSKEQQLELVEFFNKKLQEFRDQYNSLFLSSYRENKRKRIGFTETYQFISGCLEELNYD